MAELECPVAAKLAPLSLEHQLIRFSKKLVVGDLPGKIVAEMFAVSPRADDGHGLPFQIFFAKLE
jgi:hypothetical protein